MSNRKPLVQLDNNWVGLFPLNDTLYNAQTSRIVFSYRGGFSSGQTDVEVYESVGSFLRITMPSAGSLVKATLQSSLARTAGSLTAEPTKNGTKVIPSGLDCVLNATNTTQHVLEVSPDTTNMTFVEGDQIGVMFTSDATWAPTNSDLFFIIDFAFND